MRHPRRSLVLLAGGAAAAERSTSNTLSTLLQSAVVDKRVPGILVSVRQHGRLIYEESAGYAVLETGRKMRTDDIFMIASSSKPIAATAILTLVDAGKLKLDDPVRKYFPVFAGASTVRQLLSHTSGIFGNDGLPEQVQWIRNFDRSLAAAAEGIVRAPLAYEPGTRYVYTGAGMCVAGRIVELITGLEFDEYLDRALAKPLGMTDTMYRSSKDISSRVPQIYRKTESGFTPVPAIMEQLRRRGPRPTGFLLVPGGIYSTASDLLRFLELHLHNGTVNGRRILSADLVREMRQKQTGSLAMEYGLGWTREDGDRVFGHGGAYGTYIWVDVPRDLVGVILTQQAGGQGQTLFREIRSAIGKTA